MHGGAVGTAISSMQQNSRLKYLAGCLPKNFLSGLTHVGIGSSHCYILSSGWSKVVVVLAAMGYNFSECA